MTAPNQTPHSPEHDSQARMQGLYPKMKRELQRTQCETGEGELSGDPTRLVHPEDWPHEELEVFYPPTPTKQGGNHD